MHEFQLIDVFTRAFRPPPSPRGPGDDAALLAAAGPTVVTTDAVVEGVHFTRRAFSLADVGHKALAVNLSDLAAMGATPTWFVCALGLPADVRPRHLEQLAAGMAPLARQHGTTLVGGNVTRAAQLTVTITAAGAAPRPLLRSGAKPGDWLYLSGPVGQAAAGLEVLERARRVGPAQRPLVAAQRRPTPHLAFGQLAARYATAAIDVSDGLLQDLGHLCRASRVGAALTSAALPVSDALFAWCGSRPRAVQLALRGGEDYVVLAALPDARRARFEREALRRGLQANAIGRLTRPGAILLDGAPVRGPGGFTHF